MTTIELKNALVQKILEIEDIAFLKALKTIIDSKTEGSTILLPSGLKEEIITSQDEIAKGIFTENDIFEKEFDEWLKNEK